MSDIVPIRVPIAPDATLPDLEPPTLFEDIGARMTFVPADAERRPIALDAHLEHNQMIGIGSRLQAGRVVIQIVGGFRLGRTIELTPAELLTLVRMGQNFAEKLVR